MSSSHVSGTCRQCQKVIAKSQITRHLKACLGPGGDLLVKVESPHTSYFAFFTAPRNITLAKMDDVLRGLWLECCGHLSAFVAGGTIYESNPEPDPWLSRRSRSMNKGLASVAVPGAAIRYDYDFGSTTELSVAVVDDAVRGVALKQLAVVARNELPTLMCAQCAQPASLLVGWEREPYCQTCAAALDEEQEIEVSWPYINSPRVGVCGYTGPSIEP